MGVSLPSTFSMKRHLKSRKSACNVPGHHGPVATDTIFSDTPAVDSGVKPAQVFEGKGHFSYSCLPYVIEF